MVTAGHLEGKNVFSRERERETDRKDRTDNVRAELDVRSVVVVVVGPMKKKIKKKKCTFTIKGV